MAEERIPLVPKSRLGYGSVPGESNGSAGTGDPLKLERNLVFLKWHEPFSCLYWAHCLGIGLLEQFKVVVPIAVYIRVFEIFVLGESPVDSWDTNAGLVAVVFGLCLFLEGLKLGIMPLGEATGMLLSENPPGVVMLVSFLLGVGVTFAEPAIGVLKIEGKNVNPYTDPYLWALLNPYSDALVLAIGCGVGLASMLGTARLLQGWDLMPILHASTLIVIVITMLVLMFTSIPWEAVALAWDCGAVTTGPVTVPLVLALGAGLSRSQTSQPRTVAAEEQLGTNSFGIIAIASILPIITVLLLLVFIELLVPLSVIDNDVVISNSTFFNDTSVAMNNATNLVGSEAWVRIHLFMVESRF